MKKVRLWLFPPPELGENTFAGEIVREGIRKQHAPCTAVLFAATLKISKCVFAPCWHKPKSFRAESVL